MWALALILSSPISTPAATIASYSRNSASGETTTPLPITDTHDFVKMLLGSRWVANFLPSTTIVWPALWPPLVRTQKSIADPVVSKSVALPLPSSPHWAPSTTTAGMSAPLCPLPDPSAAGPETTKPSATAPGPYGRTLANRRDAAHFTGQADASGGQLEQLFEGSLTAVAQEGATTLLLLGLTDPACRSGQGRECTQEASVGLMTPRHRPVPLPAIATQDIKATVIADSGIGIDRDIFSTLNEGLLGQHRPGKWRLGMGRHDRLGWLMRQVCSCRIRWKQGRGRASQEVLWVSHGPHPTQAPRTDFP